VFVKATARRPHPRRSPARVRPGAARVRAAT